MSEVKSRPKTLPSQTQKISTGCGSLYVRVCFKDNEPFEVFAQLGKAGGCSAAQLEALARSISIGLRAGVKIGEYYEHLKDIQCASPTFSEGENIKSCSDAIAKVLKQFVGEAKE
jgi:ribonucleoside-diphosphate reductase alpha chain